MLCVVALLFLPLLVFLLLVVAGLVLLVVVVLLWALGTMSERCPKMCYVHDAPRGPTHKPPANAAPGNMTGKGRSCKQKETGQWNWIST